MYQRADESGWSYFVCARRSLEWRKTDGGGGGQPIVDGVEMAEYRGGALWELDKGERVRFSHENEDVRTLYRDYLEKPCGQRSHHLLHTDHHAWQMPPAPPRET